MVNSGGGFYHADRAFRAFAGIKISTEAWEIAAGYFEAYFVAGEELIGRRPEIDGELINLAGVHELGLLLGVSVAGAQDAIG